jgi:hypothetical protein
VAIYRKIIDSTSAMPDDYFYIGTYNTEKNKSLFLTFEYLSYYTTIYRFIPVCDGIIGSSFSNLVVKPLKYNHQKTLTLTSKVFEGGIDIQAKNIPPDVISIQFLKKNLSLKQSFTFIDSPKLINSSIRQADFISVVDNDLINESIYQFSAKCFYMDGTTDILGCEIVEYSEETPGKISINIEDLEIDYLNDVNVTFNVNMEITDTDLDQIKNLLEKQGNFSFFSKEIEDQRKELKSLIAFQVERVNLMTGERENMGTHTNSLFSDKTAREKMRSKKLESGSTYRYIIQALVRQTETMFENFIKKNEDVTTKKVFFSKPWKFSHPKTLKTGTIFTPTGIKKLYAKNSFSHGLTGSSSSIEINIGTNNSYATNAKAQIFNKNNNLITWQINGKIEHFDHFIILKESHGMRTIIGCAHNQFKTNNCEWLHSFNASDIGELKYVIIPVLNDYNHLNEIITNSIIIEASK